MADEGEDADDKDGYDSVDSILVTRNDGHEEDEHDSRTRIRNAPILHNAGDVTTWPNLAKQYIMMKKIPRSMIWRRACSWSRGIRSRPDKAVGE